MMDLSLDAERSISGLARVVQMEVTHPECPLSSPLKVKDGSLPNDISTI